MSYMAIDPLDPYLLEPDELVRLEADERREYLELLESRYRLAGENRLAVYCPYPKQTAFHNAGGDPSIRERLLMAASQSGKTFSAAAETAMHLTGLYPEDWEGAFFDAPTNAWAASITSQGTRDTVQRLLLGAIDAPGTGLIPKETILSITKSAHGVAGSVESVTVKHVGGGTSRITFKTYDQGRERWQGETLDFVWFDEEPPEDIYLEGLTRTNATNGIVYMTFTPLLGMSTVVKRFIIDKSPGTTVVQMSIEEAGHYTDEQRAAIIASYPEHERKARTHGIPIMGSGMVFPVAEEKIKCAPFKIPDYWARIVGIDFGWDHPFAAAWLAIDLDTDTIYVYDCYRESKAIPAVHIGAIRPRGDWIPVAWPHDGLQHDKGSGEELAKKYKLQGLNMLKAKATHPPGKGQKEGEGGNSVEAGIMDLLDRMMTGRFKVFSHLNDFFEEFRLYHREEGQIVKENDDLISACRYGAMMKRHAKTHTAIEYEQNVTMFEVLDADTNY